MDSKPLVSILTPSFNQGRFIRDCLASVAAQTYPDIEQIVMDGGSSDATIDYLRSAGNGRLHWVSEPDRGQTNALVKAFGLSRGQIIGWVNSDDGYATANIVERIVNEFTRRPEIGLIYAHALVVDSRSEVLHVLKAVPNLDLINLGSRIYQPTVFARRDVLTKHGFVDEAFDVAMDYEWLMRLKNRGVRFAWLDAFAAVDRHHPARKVEQQVARLKSETDRVRPAPGLAGRLQWRFRNAALRLEGISLVDRLYRGELLPIWRLPRRVVLVARQVLVPRRFQG